MSVNRRSKYDLDCSRKFFQECHFASTRQNNSTKSYPFRDQYRTAHFACDLKLFRSHEGQSHRITFISERSKCLVDYVYVFPQIMCCSQNTFKTISSFSGENLSFVGFVRAGFASGIISYFDLISYVFEISSKPCFPRKMAPAARFSKKSVGCI